ncbi:hypothetical protein BGZ94_004077 [Podila epigama]|nr:hypothetical protein BGZ94_004077 [Podila epigama]
MVARTTMVMLHTTYNSSSNYMANPRTMCILNRHLSLIITSQPNTGYRITTMASTLANITRITVKKRHVSLPKAIAKHVPNELMTEEEWRSLGVKQSQGWEHYMIHSPEPHVLLFKREKDYQTKYQNGKP